MVLTLWEDGQCLQTEMHKKQKQEYVNAENFLSMSILNKSGILILLITWVLYAYQKKKGSNLLGQFPC